MAVLLLATRMMDLRLRTGEIDPKDAGAAIMHEHQIGLPVSIDVGHPSALSVVAVGYEVTLPHCIGLFGVFIPKQAVGDPAGGHEIGSAGMSHVNNPLAAV